MVYRRFSVLVVIRIGLMLINMTLIARFVGMPNKLFTSIVLILILVGQVYELLYYVNKTNRSLSNFLDALKDKSYSSGNIEVVDKSFRSLNQSFKNIAQTIFDSKIEKEAQFHLLNLIIDKVQTGIILINSSKNIVLINQAASNNLNLNNKTYESVVKQIPFLKDTPLLNAETKKIIDININQKNEQFLTYFTPVKLIDKKYILVTFNNIQEELDRKEVQSWQKLLRTLSHEIMNSVTPISSLAETSLTHIQKENGVLKNTEEIKLNNLEKIQRALSTIEKRSSGLYDFVNDFRKLAKIPEPVKSEFRIQELFDAVTELLFQGEKQKKVHITVDVSPDKLLLKADYKLIEQVLINLLLNAKDAATYKEQINIELKATKNNHKIYIQVKDDGVGIDASKLDQIFIPFYTTKENGSGIGLSLSRQIMYLHDGNITVTSKPGTGTTFTLVF